VTDLDVFTLTTSTGSDTVTALTVTLVPTGAFNNIAQVDLTDNSNLARCTAVTNPGSNTISFSSCNSNGGVTVTTSATTYKVRITPKTHANMPAPASGASYATTGTVTSFTSTNTQAGTDSGSATITIDNLSPANVTSASGSAGDAQVTTNWTNPVDADFHSTIVLRRAGTAVSDTPTEGATYTNGSTIGASTVACVVSSPTATCVDGSLTNGTAYHYKLFSKDSNGNYASSGAVPTGSPFTPSITTFTITASAGANGTVTPSGATVVAQGSSQLYNITPNSGYNIATLVVDGSSIATSTTYTFNNVQQNHTISATFALIPVITYTITSSAGANGAISPSGATVVNQGANQSYDLTPDSGYNVDTLTVDGSPAATSTPYTFTNVQADHTISVTFIAIVVPPGSFIINATAGAGGTINPLGSTLVTQGTNQLYTITPDSGYNIATLTVDSVSVATSTSYTFTNVQTTHTIDATFVAIPPPPGSFNITASTGANGSITPSGITAVTQGASQAYTITPDSGYDIATLVIDGSSVATSTSYTFTNVQAAHTISATFVAISGTSSTPESGASRPTTITFFGKAFAGGKVSIANKLLSTQSLIGQEVTPGTDGSFRISFVGILQGLQSFGLIAKDKNGHTSQTKFFFFDTTSEGFVEKELLLPPTIDILSGQVTRGKSATVVGFASPNNSVALYIDDILIQEVLAEKDGSYTFGAITGALSFGQHNVKAKQINKTSKTESDFSTTRTFIVSQLTITKADFSGDGKIDIKDWSIFLSRWISKNPLERESIDITGDGKVDISDFSIFIKTIRKK
jgi:predicted ester cyclase